MSNFQLEWSIEGNKELSRVLLGMAGDLKDYTQPFTASADFLKRTYSKDVFETQGAAIGEKWKRLSPYTVAQKARRGLSPEPLVGSGRMQRGFQSIVSSDQAVVFNDTPYFKFHQSKAPRSRLPRRVMMKLADQQKETIVRYFQEHIRESMRRR